MSFARPPATGRPAARLAASARFATVRATFATLDRLAPDRAAQRAIDLWCTLPGNAGRRRDHRPDPGRVERLALPGGLETVVESWGEGPVVHLVHGWGGWRGQLGSFVAPLVATGHRVVALDAPGHGDARPGALGPGRGNALELYEAFAAVARAYGPARGVVAHSLGCTITGMAVRDGVEVDRLVLVGPSPEVGATTHEFARILGFGERTRSRMQARMEEYTGRPITDFDLVPIGADGSAPPTLVIHDRRDKESPFAVGERLAAAWPTARLHPTDGLGHQRILADPGTVAVAVSYLAPGR